eukprot:TRINITY_DN3200_c1_g1_i1.p1 TRINITY_DN3200_c1_g1~~TRINITY_DN3200_c1_g1_i1.p1  ORF type:complete len:232 (-),score=-17.71 TRINITY_DN3200_c1_g1_i1:125-820(-)
MKTACIIKQFKANFGQKVIYSLFFCENFGFFHLLNHNSNVQYFWFIQLFFDIKINFNTCMQLLPTYPLSHLLHLISTTRFKSNLILNNWSQVKLVVKRRAFERQLAHSVCYTCIWWFQSYAIKNRQLVCIHLNIKIILFIQLRMQIQNVCIVFTTEGYQFVCNYSAYCSCLNKSFSYILRINSQCVKKEEQIQYQITQLICYNIEKVRKREVLPPKNLLLEHAFVQFSPIV